MLTFNIFASLAEVERDLIRKRTKTDLNTARAKEFTVEKRNNLI
ncbi:hypothetical protein GS398_14700 [Pedobacter sp. HMF7056]|uniref:Resolvase/invertase-type recombinase catalytic domain-containing protein n=1 Tax=Hufsiella ginkgonis TaxID=2695274 RepID=A0A7K1Y004_9SPHI|nr:hypothetical protein [Hufsiella ginkgonis]